MTELLSSPGLKFLIHLFMVEADVFMALACLYICFRKLD